MKDYRMPSVFVLCVFSTVSGILGVAAAGYLLVNSRDDFKTFLFALMLLIGSIICAGIFRMVGNIGQTLFDIRQDMLHSTNEILNRGFSSLITALQELNKSLSGDLQSILRTSDALSQDTKQTNDLLNKGFSSLNQDLKGQLQSQAASLITALQELNKSLSGEIHAFRGDIGQINLNAKNVSDRIEKIKMFFEQIERHLDLKK